MIRPAAALLFLLSVPGAPGPGPPDSDPGGASSGGPAEARERREYGALLFKIYCANCHGESGRGDGPTAEVLTVKPADLTRIRKRHGGEFPRETIYRLIDGRQPVPGHGRGRMPIWGLGFQQLDSEIDQEAEVAARIRALIEYLESIQRSPSR